MNSSFMLRRNKAVVHTKWSPFLSVLLLTQYVEECLCLAGMQMGGENQQLTHLFCSEPSILSLQQRFEIEKHEGESSYLIFTVVALLTLFISICEHGW